MLVDLNCHRHCTLCAITDKYRRLALLQTWPLHPCPCTSTDAILLYVPRPALLSSRTQQRRSPNRRSEPFHELMIAHRGVSPWQQTKPNEVVGPAIWEGRASEEHARECNLKGSANSTNAPSSPGQLHGALPRDLQSTCSHREQQGRGGKERVHTPGRTARLTLSTMTTFAPPSN